MDGHPTSQQLLRFLGSETAHQNRRIARHLLECDRCRGLALDALRPEALGPAGARVLPYRPAGGGAQQRGAGWRERLLSAVREVESGDLLAADLRRHPRDRWRLIVPNQERFHSLPVVQQILAEGREATFADPRLAIELTELALEVLDRLDPRRYDDRLRDDVRGRAWGQIGAARRFAGDLAGAEEAFLSAGELLASSVDPAEVGNYLHWLAGLRKDQRRFDEARALLRQAIELFEDAGDDPRIVRSLTLLGILSIDEGSPGEALPPLLEAVERVDEEGDPRTALYARHNLALSLAELGEYGEARRLAATLKEACERFGDAYTLLRVRWLDGLIASGYGEDERAEALLRGVREALAAEGHDYDAALVSLDLAVLLARQRRSGELRRLAEEMVGVFVSHDIHREAAAALGLFRAAVAQERATVDLVAAIGRYLKRARHRPDLRFGEAG